MTRFLGLFLLFCITSHVVIAQSGGIRGVVKDDTDQRPVAGATVVIYLPTDSTKTGRGNAVTDARGNFLLLNVPINSYNLEITSIGYEPFNAGC